MREELREKIPTAEARGIKQQKEILREQVNNVDNLHIQAISY